MKLTDRQREWLTEGSRKDVAPWSDHTLQQAIAAALARIDELEGVEKRYEEMVEASAKAHALLEALRRDVADLRGALEAVALRTNADDSPCFCAIRIPTGTAHHLSCQRAAGVLARTAPK